MAAPFVQVRLSLSMVFARLTVGLISEEAVVFVESAAESARLRVGRRPRTPGLFGAVG